MYWGAIGLSWVCCGLVAWLRCVLPRALRAAACCPIRRRYVIGRQYAVWSRIHHIFGRTHIYGTLGRSVDSEHLPIQQHRTLVIALGLSVISWERWPHVNVGIRAALVHIDLRHQTPKVLRCAMKIKGLTIWPLFNEDEVPGILIVDEEFMGDVQLKKQESPRSKDRGLVCARYWDRTSDPFRVREVRYRCANRANVIGESRVRLRRIIRKPVHSERMTRFELATLTLAR